MNSVDVLDGFLLYSLLLDHTDRSCTLILPHDVSSQRLHLDPLLSERNAAMEGFGEEHYGHACKLCCLIFEDEEGELGIIVAFE